MLNRFGLATLLLTGATLAGCGSHGHGDTLPACVEAHGSLTEVDAIAECLSDELGLTFATQTECEAYVEANGGFASSRTAACEKYFDEGADAALAGADAATGDAAGPDAPAL